MIKAVLRGAVTAALALLACAPSLRADDGIALKKALIGATVKAIELEAESYKSRLKTAEAGTGPAENVERFRRRLAELEAERAAYSRLKPEEYPEPVRQAADSAAILEPSPGSGPVLPPVYREVRLTGNDALQDGALLSVEGTSKSGPFYHLAGIAGGDHGVLKRGSRSRLTLCLVYRREYFGLIGDFYVYVVDAR